MNLVFLTGKDYMWGCGQIGKKCEGAYHFTIFVYNMFMYLGSVCIWYNWCINFYKRYICPCTDLSLIVHRVSL